MARLGLHLLGPFEVTLDGIRLARFASDKVRALLAYVAVTAGQPHRRDTLAGLLWPNVPDATSRNSLRQAVFQLRRALNDRDPARPYFLTSPQSIEFNAISDYWLDVTAFTALLYACERHAHPELETCAVCADRMQRAVELYRGEFMAGFSAPGCVELEEWVLMKQEELHNLALSVLTDLTDFHLANDGLAAAGRYADRQLEMEPWREEAHRQRMQVFAQSGQFSSALHQYETCKRILADSLGIEPAAKTARLAERIREQMVADAGPIGSPLPPTAVRVDEVRDAERTDGPPPVKLLSTPLAGCGAPFGGREDELAVLNGCLDQALKNQGRVIFVTGEAGSGKTALVTEFARRAADDHANLVVAAGSCSAYGGAGDPYQPFVEIVRMLGHGVELEADSGCGGQWVERLRAAAPVVLEAFRQHAPDVVNSFMPLGTGRELSTQERSALASTDLESAGANSGRLPGIQLFAQVTESLQALAQSFPLLLIVEDLQWADKGTLSLLFHLGRRLGGSQILLIGTYRVEDVAHGLDTGRHPLESLVNEFQRDSALVGIDLNLADGRKFVDAFFDVQPMRLGSAFREKIYQLTEGHPLFMTELLHSLQERGGLQRDPDGRWVEGPHLDWRGLPPRVEAVIAERIERLPQDVQEVLEAASVAGDEFIAEIVADVRGVDERVVVRWLNGTLSQQDGLVRAHRLQRLDGRQLSCYRFRHHMFQGYLYQRLSEMARVQLHEQVGNALEAAYAGGGEGLSAVSAHLAWHFEMAGRIDKAVDYLEQAGQRAFQLSAYEDAIVHFNRGLALLWRLPDPADRARRELSLQLALANAFRGRPGLGGEERIRAYARAAELCRQLGNTEELHLAMQALFMMSQANADIQQSRMIGARILQLANDSHHSLDLALAQFALGSTLLYLADLQAARDHLEQALALYDSEQHHAQMAARGQDLKVMSHATLAQVLGLMGYPDQALRQVQEALDEAERLNEPDILCFALGGAITVHGVRREIEPIREYAAALRHTMSDKRLWAFKPWAEIGEGWARVASGQPDAGLAQIRQGIATRRESGLKIGLAFHLAQLAEACLSAGQVEDGIAAVADAKALAAEAGVHGVEAELHRLHGELLLARGQATDGPEAEASFQRAIRIAQQQEARLWELRATASLARLWQSQGCSREAQQALADIYGWFTEGFDTPDLRDARELLAELAGTDGRRLPEI